MGCFSFKCKGCNTPVNSNSFKGEYCHLFLLKNSKVIQQMTGDYNSYGSVFIDGSKRSDVQHDLRQSEHWKDPTPEIPLDEYWQTHDGGPSNPGNHEYWLRVCSLMEDRSGMSGIAAYHVECYKGVLPTEPSDSDPNQGSGKLRKKYMQKKVP